VHGLVQVCRPRSAAAMEECQSSRRPNCADYLLQPDLATLGCAPVRRFDQSLVDDRVLPIRRSWLAEDGAHIGQRQSPAIAHIPIGASEGRQLGPEIQL